MNFGSGFSHVLDGGSLEQASGTMNVDGALSTNRPFSQTGGTLTISPTGSFHASDTTVDLLGGDLVGDPDVSLTNTTLTFDAAHVGDARFLIDGNGVLVGSQLVVEGPATL